MKSKDVLQVMFEHPAPESKATKYKVGKYLHYVDYFGDMYAVVDLELQRIL